MSDLELQLSTAQQELKAVYRERAHLVAVLAALLPSTLAYSDPTTPDWPVLTVDGGGDGYQMSWHIAPDDVDLFAHIPVTEEGFAWDGHSTEEKYGRVRSLAAGLAELMAELNMAGLPDLVAKAFGEDEPDTETVHLPEPEPEPEHEAVQEEAAAAAAPEPKKATAPRTRAKKAGA